MDLYGDLPESGSSKPQTSQSQNKSPRVLSSPKITFRPKPKTPKNDLFGDLPAAVSDDKQDSPEKRKHDNSLLNSNKDEPKLFQEPPKKKPPTDILTSTGFFAERKGERDEMQDAHAIINDYLPEVPNASNHIKRLSFYAVFDGHGGSRASKFACENLHRNLAQRFPKGDISKVEADVKKCFIESFKKTDEDFLKEASKRKPSWKDGSTATSVLIINNMCYVANIGDSRAIICRYNEESKQHVALTLTKDHSPIDYEERMRIQKAGGHVREGRLMGALEVSRSFGDGPYKKHGITVIPDVKRCTLTKNDRFLLIACDGLWKAFDNESAIKTVNAILKAGSSDPADVNKRYEQACQHLAKEAVRKLSADNVTVIIVRIS